MTSRVARFTPDDGGFVVTKRTALDARDSDNYGCAVAMTDTIVVVGAPLRDGTVNDAGAACTLALTP